MTDAVISLRELTVNYGNVRALDDVTVEFQAGAVGLLGPNGAGKTTLLRVLLGLLRPDCADVRIGGQSPASRAGRLAIRQDVGYMPEGPCLLPRATGVETVMTLARISGLPRTEALTRAHIVLDEAGLDEARFRDASTYSLGMQQRLKLAQALVHDPRILLLDEPTNGLDPNGRASMLETVRRLAYERGKTVVVCSHLLPDIERTCEQVVVLHRGRVRANGSIAELTRGDGHWLRVDLLEDSGAERFCSALDGAALEWHEADRGGLRVRAQEGVTDADAILELAVDSGVVISGLEPVSRSLEDAFLALLSETDA